MVEVVNVVFWNRTLDDTYSSYYSSDDNDNSGSKTGYMNRLEYSEGEM